MIYKMNLPAAFPSVLVARDFAQLEDCLDFLTAKAWSSFAFTADENLLWLSAVSAGRLLHEELATGDQIHLTSEYFGRE